MSTEQVDYEDLTTMRLDDEALQSLVGGGGECIFNWTTTDGFPVGVVVAYVYRDGKFWTTCADRRKRVPALRKRPQSGIVINRNGKTASYKGDSIVHANGDADFDELKTWFYATLSGVAAAPEDAYRRAFVARRQEHRVEIRQHRRHVGTRADHVYARLQLRLVERLDDEVIRARVQPGDDVLRVRHTGEHEDVGLLQHRRLADAFAQLHAVRLRHDPVEDGDGWHVRAAEHLPSLLSVLRLHHLMPPLREQGTKAAAHHQTVIGYENFH